MKVPVSSTIERDDWERWKRSGLKLGHVIRLGLMSAEQSPGYIGRIRELETGNDKLQKKITFLMDRVNQLERGAK